MRVSLAAAAVLAAGLAAPPAISDEGATGPHVFTNEDLPTELSVSVVGTLTIDGEPAGWPDHEEIEALARINYELQRRDREWQQIRAEPRVVIEIDDFYPVSNVGPCGLYGTRCFGFGGKPIRPYHRVRTHGVRFREDGSPHLGPVTGVPDTIRGRPIIRHQPPWSAGDARTVRNPRGARGGAVLHRGPPDRSR